MSCGDEGLALLSLTERKKLLRKRAKLMLKDLFSDSNLACEMAKSVASYFLNSDIYKNAPAVFAYMAMSDEIDLKAVMERTVADGKKLYLPRMKPGTSEMDFYLVENLNSDFSTDNPYKIREPSASCPVAPVDEIPDGSAFLVPGLAFNLNGDRLGRGKGYYDRYLSAVRETGKKVFFCGVCTVNVITKAIPVEENDVYVTNLLSEYGFVECKR